MHTFIKANSAKRLFLSSMIFFVILAQSGCATGQRSSPAESAAGSLPVIDAHMHTRFSGERERTSGISITKQQFLEDLRQAGVVGGVAHTYKYDEGYVDLASHNVIHCAGVGAKINVRKLEQGLREGKYRCVKVYLGYVHQYAHHERYQPVYRLAEKYDIPVVFHTGDTYSIQGKLKYAHPLTIDEVAVDHPRVRFVIAHVGNPWIQSAAEVAYKNPNVYLDVSALLIGDLNKLPKEQVEEYVVKPLAWVFGYVENPSKLMFGSDWPLTNIKSYVDAVKRAIPEEHWRAVFHDNAVKVFKLNAK